MPYLNIEDLNGYYKEPHNAYDLSNKIKLLHNSPNTAKTLGMNGKS